MSPRVSFVVLCYNFESYIADCVQSILDQRGDHEFEIIVVDDASTDGSVSILSSFDDPRIRLILHDRNQGHAATVTDGLVAARGQLVARIDGDDRYRPTFLDDVIPFFDAHPDVALVYGDAAMIDEEGNTTAAGMDRVHHGKDYKGNELAALLASNFICAPTVIARREAWLEALPIPQGLAFHDWYFTTVIARRSSFYFRARVLADYRVHPGNYHTLIARNKKEEPSIIRLLDMTYADRGIAPDLRMSLARSRRSIYAAHYLDFAQKYFGFRYNADARRCYWQAIRLKPSYALRPSVLRQLLGTIIGRHRYEYLKQLVKRA